jgi:hypothetical protein
MAGCNEAGREARRNAGRFEKDSGYAGGAHANPGATRAASAADDCPVEGLDHPTMLPSTAIGRRLLSCRRRQSPDASTKLLDANLPVNRGQCQIMAMPSRNGHLGEAGIPRKSRLRSDRKASQ